MLTIIVGILINNPALARNCPYSSDWGSMIRFDNAPERTNWTITQPPVSLVIAPKLGEDASAMCTITPVSDNAGSFKNGEYDIYAFRPPYTLGKYACKIKVADWKSGIASQNWHYCVHAYGACEVHQNSGEREYQMHVSFPTDYWGDSSAGDCG